MSNNSAKALNFESLLAKAIGEWPEHLELPINRIDDGGYWVSGLTDVSETIDSNHIGDESEVVIRNLHHAIMTSLHEVAFLCLRIRPADLRPDFIKEKFQRYLRDGISNPGLGWSEGDIAAAQYYLA